MNDFSPMMTQYLKTKGKYADCILFYRLGDFYEMFFEDAIKASEILDLTLTSRDCGKGKKAPMCGVPYHAADEYIAKLVNAGEKVAVCEQLTEPKKGDIVKRDVIKIVSAGTITNDELINTSSNNFLASVYVDGKNVSLSWADITTGEFFTKRFSGDKAYFEFIDELVKNEPAEIICNQQGEQFNAIPLVEHRVLPKFKVFTESEFNHSIAKTTLEIQLKVRSLDVFGLEENDICINSAGALISYLKQSQRHALVNVNSIKIKNAKDYVMLDINAVRNLEIVKSLRDNKKYGSLLWVLDKTKTAMGARRLLNWVLFPLNDIDKINHRLDGVEALYSNTVVRQNLCDLLSFIKDVGRLAGKLSNNNFYPKDCNALKTSLEVLPQVKFLLSGISSNLIFDAVNSINDFSDVVKLLSDAIVENPPTLTKDGGFIKKGFNSELDELKSIKKNGVAIINEIESRERERTGIKNLKINYNRVFGYYIEVTNSYKDKVPYDYVRKQTLTNAERYITDELKEMEVKILSSEESALLLENKIYNQIKEFLLTKIDDFIATANAIADLDAIYSLSTVAKENNYVKPSIINSDKSLKIVDGRHPVVEKVIKQKFVPNDCFLDCDENRTMILTGPNMAGKSTYMRQIALITLMAHVGSFVPAKQAEITLTDKIFTRIGASDNLILDQSTFMVEMTEMADILNNATQNSLIILDEIGRGTSTYDGLSIAWAIVEHITTQIKAKTLFATHYHELTQLEGKMEGVKNYKVTVKELQDTIVFLRKVMRGGANRSFGIEVAELAGVGLNITERAKKILKQLEKRGESKIDSNNSSTEETVNLSEVERIILDLDLNNLSPMQAFNVLNDLNEKVRDKNG